MEGEFPHQSNGPKKASITLLPIGMAEGVKEFTFLPIHGPYRRVGKEILDRVLISNIGGTKIISRARPPTSREYLHMLYSLYDSPSQLSQDLRDPYAVKFKDSLRLCHHWVFRRTRTTEKWSKNKGIFFYDDPTVEGLSRSISEKDLACMLGTNCEEIQDGIFASREGKTIFASKGTYAEGAPHYFRSYGDVKKDGAIIGLCGGLEEADMFARIARFFSETPLSWKLDCEKRPGTQGIAALSEYGGGLSFDGCIIDSGETGLSLGVKV